MHTQISGKLWTELDRLEAEGIHEGIGVVEAKDMAKGQGKASIDEAVIKCEAAEEGRVHQRRRCKPSAVHVDFGGIALPPLPLPLSSPPASISTTTAITIANVAAAELS